MKYFINNFVPCVCGTGSRFQIWWVPCGGGRKGMRETYRVRPTVLVRCVLWCVLDETPVVVVREFAKGAKSVD